MVESTKTIQRRKNEIGIYAARGMKERLLHHQQAQLVLDEITRDPNGRKGPRTIKRDIALETGIHLTRSVPFINVPLAFAILINPSHSSDFVDGIMHEFCPDGYVRRNPLNMKIKRSPLSSLGPNDEWSADGHDKLIKIGIAVYGFRDKATGKWLSLRVVPNNRLNLVITYLYLSLVEERGGK